MNQLVSFKVGQKFTSTLSFRNEKGIKIDNATGTIAEINPNNPADEQGILLKVDGVKKLCFVDLDYVDQIKINNSKITVRYY